MNAAEIVAEAIATHGRPLWVAHVPKPIRHQVDAQWLDEVLATAQRSSDYLTRKDQYEIILDWCKRNVFEEVTVDSLSDLCETFFTPFPSLQRISFVTDKPSLADCKSDEIKKCAKQKNRLRSYWLKKKLKNIFGTFWE